MEQQSQRNPVMAAQSHGRVHGPDLARLLGVRSVSTEWRLSPAGIRPKDIDGRLESNGFPQGRADVSHQ